MIITIARQCGCNAIRIGEQLANRYALPLYTRQKLMELAQEKGILAEMRDFFEEDPVDDLMNAITSFTDELESIRKRFMDSFNKIIEDKNCIIIGRCGNRIFEHRTDLFSFFLHGDIKTRTQNIAKEKGISLAEAEEFVDDMDNRRISYHKFYTGLTWGNSADYDMSIDCCRMGVTKTTELIEEYISELS